MAAQIPPFIHGFHDDQDFATVMASTRGISRFGDGPTAESRIHFRCVRKQNIEYVRRVHSRVENWSRRLARAELRTEQRLYFCELSDSLDSSIMPHQSTKVTRTTSIVEPSLIEPTNVTNCLKHVPPSQHNHGRWYGPNQSWQGHWQFFVWGHSQDSWDPSESHNWRWQAWIKRDAQWASLCNVENV